jgi:hypothetical protein
VILVDSSAWIEFYRPNGQDAARFAVSRAMGNDEVASHGIVRVEILAFARDEADRRKLSSDFSAFHWIGPLERDYDLAIDLGFSLRRRGLTIPTTDLLIAASAIRAECQLFHLDDHFDQVAAHSQLQSRHLGRETGSYVMEPR